MNYKVKWKINVILRLLSRIADNELSLNRVKIATELMIGTFNFVGFFGILT